MTGSSTVRRRLRAVWQPLMAIAVLGYFGFHALHGDRGLLAYQELGQQLAVAQSVHAEVRMEKEKLQARVAALRPESLDPDMLEERALALLNFGSSQDIVILRTAAPNRAF